MSGLNETQVYRVGHGVQFHWLRGGYAACSSRSVEPHSASNPDTVPERQRCFRVGCDHRWATAPAFVSDRAAALRDVEALLRRVDGVMTDEDEAEQVEPVRFTMPTDRPGVGTSLSPADLAALIVDRVLGVEQDGETP